MTDVLELFCRCFFLRGRRWGRWRERFRGVIATCHFIQLHFNLGCLEESCSANDSTKGVVVLEEGNRDLSCWYLATNHLHMNCSPSNGNPYSSSSPKALLWGWRRVAAFRSSPYPLPHPCTLIKTPTYFKVLHHPLTHIEFLLLHHCIYGPSLGLLMARHRVTHMNMEISHTVHMLSYNTGLIEISDVFLTDGTTLLFCLLFLIMCLSYFHYLCI